MLEPLRKGSMNRIGKILDAWILFVGLATMGLFGAVLYSLNQVPDPLEVAQPETTNEQSVTLLNVGLLELIGRSTSSTTEEVTNGISITSVRNNKSDTNQALPVDSVQRNAPAVSRTTERQRGDNREPTSTTTLPSGTTSSTKKSSTTVSTVRLSTTTTTQRPTTTTQRPITTTTTSTIIPPTTEKVILPTTTTTTTTQLVQTTSTIQVITTGPPTTLLPYCHSHPGDPPGPPTHCGCPDDHCTIYL